MRRLILLGMVALGLAPGTWVRSPPEPFNGSQALTVTPLRAVPQQYGEFRFVGAWQLDSPNTLFGGYSGLVVLPGGRLLAASDGGGMLEFDPPDVPSAAGPVIDYLARRHIRAKWQADLESLTLSPADGRFWAAYESSNAIVRLDADLKLEKTVSPEPMRRWRGNSGPEAMARLRDGRFIVLAERNPGWFFARRRPGLLFAADPVEDAQALAFEFLPPDAYSPSDMAELPDGRVVILLRRLAPGWPPRFPTRLAVADPAEIRAGKPWRAQVVADLFGAIPGDNYEGVAVQPDGRGGATLWIISDDNGMTVQRTLLLKFAWAPTKKARGSPARPSDID